MRMMSYPCPTFSRLVMPYTNKQKRKEYKRKYYWEHKEYFSKYSKEYGVKRRQKYKEMTEEQRLQKQKRQRTWYNTPNGKLHSQEKWRRRHARKLNQLGPTPPTIEQLKELLSKPCAYCSASSEQIDHIIPISKGGLHDISNVVGACKPCNLMKSDKDVETFKKQLIGV